MKRFCIVLVGLLGVVAPSVNAQGVAPKNWLTISGGAILDPPNLVDPTTNSRWEMGTGTSFGAALHHRFGEGLMIGFDGSYAPSIPFEFHDQNSDALLQPKDNAHVASAMLSGRLQYGGGGSLGIYLSGGIGGFFWGVPELAPSAAVAVACACTGTASHWDADVGILTGAGLEYKVVQKTALFLEWGRFWVFHEHSGVSSNSIKFTGIKLGARFGL
jgi:opacity protein-like surface antigen